jgi:ubiquinone/menaquinone biosynthesis C-methylase UbiE
MTQLFRPSCDASGKPRIGALAEMGFDFRALDAAPEGVRLTRDRVGLNVDDARITVGDFINLPYEDQCFDAVIERASLCCNLSDDLRAALSEIERVLKPGGVFIGVDMYGENTTDLQFGTPLGDGDYNAFTDGIFVHSQEVHAFTPEQISKFFTNFEIESLERVSAANLLADDHNRETYNLIARKLGTKT